MDNKLQSFMKVVELGSFTKAAEALSLSQPAVTQHIKQLEEAYGIHLFARSRHRLQLTREGEILLKYAHRFLAMDKALEQELKKEQGRLRFLTVGITHTAESSVIIEALAAFGQGLDKPSLKILTNTTENLYTMLKNYELDFAFVDRELPSPHLIFTPLDTDNIVLAVAPEHPLAAQKQVSLGELKKEPMILRLPNSGTRNLFVSSLESKSLSIRDFNIVIEIDSIATIKDLIRRNFGVSVLAKSACLDEFRKGKLALLPIEDLSMERTTYIVSRQDFEHPEIIDAVVKSYQSMPQL